MFIDQAGFDIRCEWGLHAIDTMAAPDSAVVIVDVLSFSSCVDIAVSNGAKVFPYRYRDETAVRFANEMQAVLAASKRAKNSYSLSPVSLLKIPTGTRLVLPSPNGSTLTLGTNGRATLAGCLRNCEAVAKRAAELSRSILVVPAGERWRDGLLRFAVEDLIGAGAIIHFLNGTKSPEAVAAEAAFTSARKDLPSILRNCSSGRELIEKGFEEDVDLAGQLNCSRTAPRLVAGAYVA